MIFLHSFGVAAASRGEGLHPKIRSLLERAVASPFSELSIRHDGLTQAGPNSDSEIIPSRVNVILFPRYPSLATPKRLFNGGGLIVSYVRRVHTNEGDNHDGHRIRICVRDLSRRMDQLFSLGHVSGEAKSPSSRE
jgi:hypothetical protein